MFSFLREAKLPDGSPGPLSMRRVSAALCFLASIAAGIVSLAIIYRFIAINPNTTIDWKAFIPLFVPCVSFLFGGLLLLFFTTWGDVAEIAKAIKK